MVQARNESERLSMDVVDTLVEELKALKDKVKAMEGEDEYDDGEANELEGDDGTEELVD
jgi:DNA segregation ATPase FtsK/SpoIIIE-like protein